ncbi:MAG: alkaline phosphatase D family protein [Thermoleophilaceae bacterium]|nr:alkaline phosphatase D family protein [Thermoleophilaceae bacterium]
MANELPRAFQKDRTMLGSAQRRWLKDSLDDSSAAWKVVGNQVHGARRAGGKSDQSGSVGWLQG